MRRVPWAALLGGLLIWLGEIEPSEAHGPCPPCVKPTLARAGDSLLVEYPTYLAVWNPGRRILSRGPKPYCYGCQLKLWRYHRDDAPSNLRVFTRRPPAGRFRIEVPQVPPGRHLIALFDGTEGGTHYTWDFVRVRARAGDTSEERGGNALWVVIVVIAVGAAAGIGFAIRRRTSA